jgi:Fe2+ or Zn2+ uptake regulation protein
VYNDARGEMMIEQLFGSKTRVKLLQLFFSNPNRSFYVREITRKIDEQINSVRRELSNLLSIGIVKSNAADNHRLYYEVDQEYEYYQPLAMIFGDLKTAPIVEKTSKKSDKNPTEIKVTETAPEHALAKLIRATGHIELAILTGQFTRDDISGIDLLIVGDTNQSKVENFIDELEKSEKKELRYTVMPLDTYKYRIQINDRFIGSVLGAKKQVIINSQNLEV